MKPGLFVTFLSIFCSALASAASQSGLSEAEAPASEFERRDGHPNKLFRRKGGGGGGGRSSGGGSSSSGGSRSGSGGSTGGSGAPRSFSGGKFYGGGASQPYKAGNRSPSGISPILLVGAASLAIWPALWLYGAYHYPYTNPIRFRNDTANQDQELAVICGCDPYNPCGCDENGDSDYIEGLIGNGDPTTFNTSLVSVADVNGTKTLLINGTLPNGTTAPEDSDAEDSAAGGLRSSLEILGWWPMVVAVAGSVFMV